MKIDITKKNVIVAAAGFLAGVIITTSGFLIFRGCAHREYKRMAPPSFGQSQTYNQKDIGDGKNPSGFENGSNQNKQSKKSKSDSKSEISSPESDGSTAESNNNS